MISIGRIYQIENGFLLELDGHTFLYGKTHKDIADLLISKRVAEKLREYTPPVQQELDLTKFPERSNNT